MSEISEMLRLRRELDPDAPDAIVVNGARLAAEEIALNIAYFEDKAAQESIVDDLESIIKQYVG